MRPAILRPTTGDLVAGFAVAVVLIPQSLAYAEIAGLPPHVGLFAAAIPPIAAAFLASSRYLQTGPVAMTALLTYGALEAFGAEPGSTEWIALAALLAVLVGLIRLLLGILRAGVVAYLLSQPVLGGFMSAAALLIFASQIPAAVGVEGGTGTTLTTALDSFSRPGDWDWVAVALTLTVIAVIVVGRRVHPLFPGVPLAIVIGLVVSGTVDYTAEVVGEIGASFPTVGLALPWSDIPQLLVPALVVALVGFAEPVSIARTYATADRDPWSPDRELISQGVANLASGFSGGFPIGGSFSRTSIARMSGGHSRWTGAFVGVIVLAFLPFADVLKTLPMAVLAGILIAAVSALIKPHEVVQIWRNSPPQGIVGLVTFASTLLLAPRIDLGVMIGIGVAVLVHLWRELGVPIDMHRDDSTLTVHPNGVIFFGSAQTFDDYVTDAVADHPEVDTVVIDLKGIGRLDYTAAVGLVDLAEHLRAAGCSVRLANVNPVARRILDRVWTDN